METKLISQQFRDLEAEIDGFAEQKKKELIARYEVPAIGSTLYVLEAWGGTPEPDKYVREYTYEKAVVSFAGVNSWGRPQIKSKATRNSLKALQVYYDKIRNAEPELWLDLKKLGYDCYYSSRKASEINNIRIAWNREALQPEIEKQRKDYVKLYAPREGYVACERCGKQVPIDKAVKSKLIYQGMLNGKKAVLSRIGTFCSGECADEQQMSLEG